VTGPRSDLTDPDIDDVADALTGVTLPCPCSHPSGEIGDAVQDIVDQRYDILPIHEDGCTCGCAQRGVKDRTVLGDIGFAAGEHSVDAFRQFRVFCELEQKLERFIDDAILRIIQFDTHGRGGEAFAAGRIIGEQIAQMPIPNLFMVRFQSVPRAASRGRDATRLALPLLAFLLCSSSEKSALAAILLGTRGLSGTPTNQARKNGRASRVCGGL
jgi:hypothetical protein